jgi:hypothetical protein
MPGDSELPFSDEQTPNISDEEFGEKDLETD